MSLLGHHGFHRRRRAVMLSLDDNEREVLTDLLEQLQELVAPDPGSQPEDPLAAMVGINPDASTPTDPALARLLPDAYADAELAGEFRRFTESELRNTKTANAKRARDCLQRPGSIELDNDDVMAWLAALNDLRLVLGVRLGVTETTRYDPADSDPQSAQMYLVYDWLTYLQDRLLTVMGSPPARK